MGDNLRFYARIYVAIMAQHIKVGMSYRANFIIGTIASLLLDIVSIGVFFLIFNTVPTIAGWTFHEILFIYWFYKAARDLHAMLFGVSHMWALGGQIRSGKFDLFYLRPLNMLFTYMLSTSDFSVFGAILTTVLTATGMIYSATQLQLVWTPLHFVLLPISIFSAALVIAGFIIMAGSTAFWITESGSVLSIFFKLRDFSQYPLSIFDGFFRVLLTYFIPIGFITFYPALLFLRPNETPILSYLSPLVAVGVFALAYQVWKRGIDRYVGAGS